MDIDASGPRRLRSVAVLGRTSFPNIAGTPSVGDRKNRFVGVRSLVNAAAVPKHWAGVTLFAVSRTNAVKARFQGDLGIDDDDDDGESYSAIVIVLFSGSVRLRKKGQRGKVSRLPLWRGKYSREYTLLGTTMVQTMGRKLE